MMPSRLFSTEMAQRILPVLICVMMSGCAAVGPDYQRPGADAVPMAYAGPGKDWKIAVPQANIPKGRWWEVFGDPVLNQLEADAADGNQDLKAAFARFTQARATADVARSSLFPRLGVSVQPVDQRDSKHRPVGGKPDQTYDTLTVPFDFSYEFDLWGRVRRVVESADAQTQANADDVESVKLAIQAEIAADYLTLRALDADRMLLLSSIEVYRKSLDLIRNRRAGGMVSDLDVAQAETVLETTQAQLPDNALQRIKYKNALAALTGKNAASFHLEDRPLDMSPIAVPSGLPSELLERRPDIAAAERRMAAANANIGVAAAAFFPTVTFSGQAGFQSGGLDMLLDWPSRFWAVGPSLTLPLFRGGQLTAGLLQARAAYEETVAKYRQTVLTAFSEVENNLAAVYLIAEAYNRTQVVLQSARKQLQIAENRYKAGLVTYLDVATAQNAVLAAERSGVRLQGQQLVALAGLVKSLGGDWRSAKSSAM